MIIAFSVYLSFSSNNSTEALSPKTGLRWCLDHGKINPFWQIKDDVKHIQYMSSLDNFSFTHTLREGDTTTYLLTDMMIGHRKNFYLLHQGYKSSF
ncbi:hypothetical protein H5410_056755 [Solanum commersonii]|uniref:Uncharacterized protein n=1 Tax=Solanum commersonii TaxID=4109 RepID=A0A9J5WMP4_SOLCO|nr:hypothetical protein H5410_056755 [Solanum commersonii]